MRCFYFHLLLLFLMKGMSYSQQTDWTYQWFCSNSAKCIRQHTDAININVTLYESQNICRLFCGAYGALWPRPTGSVTLGTDLVTVNPNKIRFELHHPSSVVREFINNAKLLFHKNILKECFSNCLLVSDTETVINMYVNSEDTNLTWNTDESYSLNISTSDNIIAIQIIAQTVFGIRHGLETLSQLITIKNDSSNSSKTLVMVNSARIKDKPMYPHRGLMIDTARNFIPVKDIERTLDGMSASKLNVFHWHATDSQSFPLDIPRVPQLTRYGAYSPKHIYSQRDVQHLIKYAKYRGIRIIIEIDAPSHSGNGWQWGPEFNIGDLAVCVNKQPWRSYCIQPPCGQLNPANPNVYHVLRNIYKDLFDVQPHGETIHMGGDEVFFGCWNSSSEIVNLLIEQGHGREVSDFLQLWAEYQSASLSIWDEENGWPPSSRDNVKSEKPPKVILWSSKLTEYEHIEQYLQNDRYIIQTWVPSTDDLPLQLLAKGYSIIISTKNAWYFDHGFWGQTLFYPWRTVYNNKILRKRGVLGGEACVWTELIDGNTLDSRTWPRAAAVAERLWTDPDTNANVAAERFSIHRNRLLLRGIKPEPLAPKWCTQNEGECN